MDVVAKMFNDLESSDLKEVEENKTKLIESFSQSKLPGHFIYNTVASIAWNYHGKDCSPGTKTFFSPHALIHTPFTSKNWNQLSNDLTSLFAFFLPAFLSRLFYRISWPFVLFANISLSLCFSQFNPIFFFTKCSQRSQ